MSMLYDLNHLDIRDVQFYKIVLEDFTMLREWLAVQEGPTRVLKMLKTELQGEARQSYINRIYGRYRVLSPARDLEHIRTWRDRHGKTRSDS